MSAIKSQRTLRSRISTASEISPEKTSAVDNDKSKNARKKKVAVKTEPKSKLEITVKTEQSDENASKNARKKKVALKTEPESNLEVTVKTEQDNENASKNVKLKKSIKTEVLPAEETATSVSKSVKSKSPRKRKQVENTAVKIEKAIKLKANQTVTDIEDGWEPENWRVVLDNILKMRKMYVAPVDSLGCEECPEKDIEPEVFRYQTLISVMLSSQTRDEVTFAASQRLIEHGLTVDNILNTPDEKIGELIYPAGFWKTKIKFIKNTTRILKDQYNGDIPRTYKELCKLPGVGPKMAHIVMSVAWNDTVGIAVDTHVHRISNRLGWVRKPTKDPEETRKALEKWLPK
ncbi:hypothetical protein TNIN_314221 [Trichonephila inaurata madagascariensis]|uniref:DNA-(apurinic or apyrimidinic site) lyase n=1 Tax=Trichonephila inaurata madagascariensis TaxID=2747483 RepID=A0A8X6WUV1_9ARAC|nr:hypothetical protein TNIN_314221 [Trichonephila inaurata madagascariensis]